MTKSFTQNILLGMELKNNPSSFLYVYIQLSQLHLLKRLIFTLYEHGSFIISEVLIHTWVLFLEFSFYSIHPCVYFYPNTNIFLIIVALQYNLKLGKYNISISPFFLRITFTIQDFKWFHRNFRVFLFNFFERFVQFLCWHFNGRVLYKQNSSSFSPSTACKIFQSLYVLIFNNVLQPLLYKSFTCLARLFPKYLIILQ